LKIERFFNPSKIEINRFYLDVGIVTIMDDAVETNGKGYTWMWRKCCLDKVKEAFAMKDCKGSEVMATDYNWCFTRDTGNLTITGKKKSMIRLGGLVHSQFYAMDKLQFDATKHFPWDDDDDTLAMMAVDSTYHEALRSVVGAKGVKMDDCRISYNHCGRRFMLGVRTNDDRSWGAREEHRMSLALLMEVNSELQSRGNPEVRRRETRTQFYVHPTSVVNLFIESVTLHLARAYQDVLGMAPEGKLGTDRQKLAILLCLLVKNSYGGALLERYPFIWEKKVKSNGNGEELGLGLKDVIKKYGFGWLSPDIIDWKSNNFVAGVAERFPFPVRRLESRYRAKKLERKVMVDILQEMDYVTGRIKQLDGDEESQYFLLMWLAMRIIKQYHIDVWVGLYDSPYEFVGKEKEQEKQRQEADEDEPEGRPRKKQCTGKKKAKAVSKSFIDPPGLTYGSVRSELGEEPYPCKRGRDYVTRDEYFDLLFLSDFEKLKGGWKKLPHLRALKCVKEKIRRRQYRKVLAWMRVFFKHFCLCVPAANKDRWLAACGISKFKSTWVGFNEEDERMDYPHMEDGYDGSYGSSWHREVAIHEHYLWNIGCEDATNDEGLARGRDYVLLIRA